MENEKKDDRRADFLKFSIRFERYYLLYSTIVCSDGISPPSSRNAVTAPSCTAIVVSVICGAQMFEFNFAAPSLVLVRVNGRVRLGGGSPQAVGHGSSGGAFSWRVGNWIGNATMHEACPSETLDLPQLYVPMFNM